MKSVDLSDGSTSAGRVLSVWMFARGSALPTCSCGLRFSHLWVPDHDLSGHGIGQVQPLSGHVIINQWATDWSTNYTVSQKNVPTLASCSFNKRWLILIISSQQHQHTFNNDMHVQLSLSRHFCSFCQLLNSCDGNDTKQCVFLGRLLVGLKRAGASEKSRF